jgi:hypothetical protein
MSGENAGRIARPDTRQRPTVAAYAGNGVLGSAFGLRWIRQACAVSTGAGDGTGTDGSMRKPAPTGMRETEREIAGRRMACQER